MMLNDSGTSLPSEAMLENRIAAIEASVAVIQNRNARVDRNKSWETSTVRLLAVTAVTYVTMVLVFVMLGSQRALLDALVPTTGYFLSTLSLPIIRRKWEDRIEQSK